MKLIVGLGNPGKEYENSRHNAGWMALDALHKELDAEPFKKEKKFKGEISAGNFRGEKILLLKPLTFMNLSGESVEPIANFYKIKPADILVIYDDLDMPLGSIRIRKNGGAGTHNGMKSLVQHIGEDFPRLRIGIESRGQTAHEEQETSSFVLSPFKKEEKKTLKDVLKKALEAIKIIVSGDLDEAMNNYNSA